jgi:hypothetical protein
MTIILDLLHNIDFLAFKLQSYDLVRSNRQDRQRYFQLVKSLVYLGVTFTKYMYCIYYNLHIVLIQGFYGQNL